MLYVDHHVHTKYSPDSNADIVKYIRSAKEWGLKYIIFTDHMDFGTKDPDFMDYINFNEYIETLKRLESQHEFPIKIGIEIGYEKNYKNEIEDFLSKYKFDFVISSIHYGDGKDFYTGDFFIGKTKYEAYLDYFKLLLEMVENFNAYDVVGHMDYISRYGPYRDKHYEYENYKDIIDEILKAIIKNKKGMEVNTSGLREGLNTTYPKNEVLLRYKELGGEILTIGSDSHFNEDYGANFEEVIRNLNSLGFKIG